mmetsp:Transcript_8953/g.6294  ORF Transcript_8953/g.6294 Transcript_8953/m.6294 type:complete len:98 (+) Transcript_8953:41-334(+)|eukprot:CAMPEP_0116870542 /NCGR_PEP_ID=MMETSP0463-20121206/475_1 /TAXON_ID=181622 /ORGANISM="Strombidinopsis sp, Strain SopsisLIS2011" /LENGTH=97 /DNA_ID=CAMNT_0004507233 /DNA_START=37 /DNA_END=330 /DNA_ORIENTATION=+
MSAQGEVEVKVSNLIQEVFTEFNASSQINDEGDQYITKDQLHTFIKDLMKRAGQYEQFTDAQFDENFEQGYVEFDNDGSGQIEEKELEKFIKKYADL